MNEDADKKISDLSDEDVLKLTRKTEAEKWATSGWHRLPTLILPMILFVIPACYHIGYYLGADEWAQWSESAKLLKYAAMLGYVAMVIFMLRWSNKISRGMLERLDEVERHIEYRAIATAGAEAIWMGILAWGFALWFPGFFRAITALLPLFILLHFYFTYFGTRVKLRNELNA